MFISARWAQAFMAACKDKKEEGFTVLAACAAIAPRLGRGTLAARHLRQALYGSVGESPSAGVVSACGTATLLVQRGWARHIPTVLREAQKIYDKENEILDVRVDSAFPLDEVFTETLRARLREQTAAREVRIDLRLMPELIAGCRLHLGSDCFDASLRGQMRKMAADLHASGGYPW